MIPERIDWDEIKDLYDRAKQCLWCPRRTSGWQRDEQNGMFYLWSAYHYAGVKSTEKNAVDHKLYARILAMMNHELMYQVSDYERYINYVLPALYEYEAAMRDDQKISDKEYHDIKWEEKVLEREIEYENDPEKHWNESVQLIDNGELLDESGFEFHDSKPVYFKQESEKTAYLKLQYDNLVATLRFDEIAYIEIKTDPAANWVGDYYCFRGLGMEHISFNAGDYSITSRKITLERIVELQ